MPKRRLANRTLEAALFGGRWRANWQFFLCHFGLHAKGHFFSFARGEYIACQMCKKELARR